jgi:tetratricopeptide (TPR) repeat protein
MLAQKHAEPTTRVTSRTEDLTQALTLHTEGRFDEAAERYQRLHAENPKDSEVLFLMGLLCCDLGTFDPACRFLEEALALAKRFPEARSQLVIALNALADQQIAAGSLTEARARLYRALELAPQDAPTLQRLGRIALELQDPSTAAASFTASLAARPDHPQTLNWLGLAQLNLKNHVAAEASLRRALQLQPDLNQARNNLGLALFGQERLDEARACYETALVQDPDYAKARINLSVTLRLLGRHDEARQHLESLLGSHPDDVEVLNNLGVVLQDLGAAKAALTHLSRALELAPGSAAVRWNLSLTQLQLGDYANGWANYESRWAGCEHLRGVYRMPRYREWRGEDLRGKRLLLWGEQGIGDTIQFIRFAQDVAARGALVSVLAPPQVAGLIAMVAGVGAVHIAGNGPMPAYDFHCPLLSLPHHLGLSIPEVSILRGDRPYLLPDADLARRWRTDLAQYPGLKVGLAWAGNADRQSLALQAIDRRRSIPLASLQPILEVPGCTFFSLQKGTAAAELAASKGGIAGRIHDFSADWQDFSATAAFIAGLDVVLSVDTAVAHLAGAMGSRVWLLNRYDTCWRWLLGRSDSPWYPQLRQFRQHRPGDWTTAVAAAAAALAEAAAAAAADAA